MLMYLRHAIDAQVSRKETFTGRHDEALYHGAVLRVGRKRPWRDHCGSAANTLGNRCGVPKS